MGRKTSVYLPDDLAADVRASGVPMAELLRRGLGLGVVDEGVSREDVREIVRDEVRSALRDAQGGGL
jgi:hypothetical protein